MVHSDIMEWLPGEGAINPISVFGFGLLVARSNPKQRLLLRSPHFCGLGMHRLIIINLFVMLQLFIDVHILSWTILNHFLFLWQHGGLSPPRIKRSSSRVTASSMFRGPVVPGFSYLTAAGLTSSLSFVTSLLINPAEHNSTGHRLVEETGHPSSLILILIAYHVLHYIHLTYNTETQHNGTYRRCNNIK